MLKSLWIKFLILLTAVSLLSLSAAFFLRELMVRDFREYREGEMEDRIYWVTADLEGAYEKFKGWNKDVIAEDAVWALMLGFDITIKDLNGNLLMDSGKALGMLSPLMKRRVAGIVERTRESEARSEHVYPLFIEGREIGSLGVKLLKLQNENVFIERSNKFLVFSLVALGGLATILSVFFSKKLTKPVKKLTSAAQAVSEGNFKERVTVSGSDEIGTLANAFNTMANSLEKQETLRKKIISNVAHELRTPITVMQGELEGMADGLIPVNAEQIRSVQDETGRLKRIIEGIEELSRAEASSLTLARRTIALKPFLAAITERFGRIFHDKGVELDLVCDEEVTVDADPEKLSQVVINLLSNALKATEKEGKARIQAYQSKDDTIITVSDNGCGIKEKNIQFIFERFYRGTTEGGLGLGLTIAKELVEAHGGRIEAKSDFGLGSTFTISLPLHNSS